MLTLDDFKVQCLQRGLEMYGDFKEDIVCEIDDADLIRLFPLYASASESSKRAGYDIQAYQRVCDAVNALVGA